MNFRKKVAVFLIAVLITFFGFNLIASLGAADLVKLGKKAGFEIIANVLAEERITILASSPIDG